MEHQTIRNRLEELKNVMSEKCVDFYLIPTADFHNSEYVDDFFKVREYFSNFSGSNGTLLISQQETGLWTDGRYFIQAERELQDTGIKLFRMQEEGVPTISEYLEENVKENHCVGFDGRVIDTTFGKKLKKILDKKKAVLKIDEDLAERIWRERPSMPAHPVMILPEELCGLKMEEKVQKVMKKVEEKECKYLLLSKLDDLMWLLNIRGGDVECNPVALSYAFLTEKEVYYFIQKEAITPAFNKYAQDKKIILKEYSEIFDFLSEYPYQGKVLIDEGNLNYLLYQKVTEKTEIVNGPNPTELLKAIKNETELSHMREIYKKDSAAVTKFIYWLKKNIGRETITEITAAKHLDELRGQIKEYLDLSFPTISAYKENAAMMHYEATQENHKKLEAEGLLLVDSGGQYLGGTTDVTRTIVLGEISEEIKKHYSAVAAGMLRLSNARFLYGCTGRNLDILARKPLWDMDIDYKCGTGHGVGYILNVHEGPHGIRWKYLDGVKETILEVGMDVTNEPGVYMEGSHGIRIENVMVVCNGNKNEYGQFMHFDTYTFVPIDRAALDTRYLTKEDVLAIDSYHELVYKNIAPYLDEEEKQWLFEETRPLQ